MAERDPRERLDAILESLVDLGKLHREHQSLFTETNEYGRTLLQRLCERTSHPDVIKFVTDLCGPDSLKATDEDGNTPLRLVCRHADVSCQAIETLTRPYPEAIRIPNEGGWTPLQTASCYGASVHVVRLLIKKFRGALSMKDAYGNTPLKTACRRGGVASDDDINFEVVKLLLESYPEALFIGDNEGFTPLHIAYKNDEASQQVVRLLVDRGGEKALGMLNNNGFPPLHGACQEGYPEDIIQLMIAVYPKALQIVDKFGGTALHSACQSNVPVATLRAMILRGPAACLVLEQVSIEDSEDDDDEAESDEDIVYLPYDWTVGQEREAHVVELLSNATKDAAVAMMECALSSRTTMSTAVTIHVRAIITGAVPDFNETSRMTQSVRDNLVPDLIKTLVINDELQELLKKDEAYHHLIAGLVRMNKSGRSRALRDPSNKLPGLAVLDSISDNVDCSFLHLRENPSLCNRWYA
jgi:ankyrin repeat protein